MFKDANEFYADVEKYESGAMKKTQQKITEVLMELLQIKGNEKVLDVGAGSGLSMIPFIQKGCVVFGIEPVEKMIQWAEEKNEVDLKIWQGGFDDVEEIGKKILEKNRKEKFDVIVSVSALQWKTSNQQKLWVKNYCNSLGKKFIELMKGKGKVGIQFYPKTKEEMEYVKKGFEKSGMEVEHFVEKEGTKKEKQYLIMNI